MKNPLITIITATYNVQDVLEKCILSVVNQKYENIEYIIIDGGSTDGTIDIIRKYEKDISYWVSEKDSGIYDAWNKGLIKATGDWIAFLGADDIYLPEAIDLYINYINNQNETKLDFISSKVNLVDSDGKSIRIIGNRWKWNVFKKYMNVAHVGSFHSKLFFTKYGYYNLDYKIIGDYEMLLRAQENLNTGFIDEVTVNMQVGGVSNQNRSAFAEVIKAKISTGARTSFQAYNDNLIANFKYFIRKIIRV